ncbi:hypothetical protein C8R46DRAFT_1044904 [Mycena filopes]|nr:hypothetical protein C8R46DRAFT_1044904 [Mycena filopes]
MAGYQKPRLRLSFNTRTPQHLRIIVQLFLTLLFATTLGCSLPFILAISGQVQAWHFATCVSGYIFIWFSVLASSSSEFESDPAPKRKRKANTDSKPTKRQSKRSKGKERAVESDSDSEQGIRVTARPLTRKGGIFVDEVIHLESGLESYRIPALGHRIAYLLDLSATPQLLHVDGHLLTLDAYLKKECQDAFMGPTGSKAQGKLAKVVIFDRDSDDPVLCRRSTLTCNGCYTCSLAANTFLDNCNRWDDTEETHLQISAPAMAARAAEATSVASTASAFYRSATSRYCKSQFIRTDDECGGRAVLRRFRGGKVQGKAYFVGCSNWTDDNADKMSKSHRFTAIPSSVRESILIKLFQNLPIDEGDDDTDVLAGFCETIVHPSHLTKNSKCSRTHYQHGLHVVADLKKRSCHAQLSLLIPIDANDLRIVIIPREGIAHTHPSFPRTKIPSAVKQKYQQCIDASGPVGTSTLRVDKSSSTSGILNGKLPQELHPGMINSRKRRDMVKLKRETLFPEGTGVTDHRLPSQLFITSLPRTNNWEFRTDTFTLLPSRGDTTHVIITIDPYLASLTLEAMWIMVDTTFAVVHGKMNEWKLVIWLSSIAKRIVIGRVWSNRATRAAFVLVWDGIFTAIETITGKKLNFQVFNSRNSKLLGVIGDSEGAQAQGLGDVIILRQMNTSAGQGLDVDSLLMLIWKTCIVHFNRGVLALKAHISENDLAYLMGLPYLVSDEEVQNYYTFCAESQTTQVQNWWAHKLSYPWLLPSLNRQLSHINNRHWDLTPSDTNPIEGSHAQDNQLSHTGRSLLEAILLARKADNETARVIKATLSSGVLENGNNSVQARFSSKSQRDARTREKRRELEGLSGRDARKLREEVKTGQQKAKDAELEVLELRRQLDLFKRGAASDPHTPVAGPSNWNRANDVTPEYYSPPHSPLPALDLFPGLRSPTPVLGPRSDFDYAGALNSDILDNTLKAIVEDYPMYPISDDSDEEILASDPYPIR